MLGYVNNPLNFERDLNNVISPHEHLLGDFNKDPVMLNHLGSNCRH